jgi:hypothetical protein
MATHEGPSLAAAHLVLPADGLGGAGRHVHELPAPRAAHPPRGAARWRRATPRWQMTARAIEALGGTFAAASAREASPARGGLPDYAGLDLRRRGRRPARAGARTGAPAGAEAR